MRLNKFSIRRVRNGAGFVIGECVHCILLAFGLMWALVLILNGFDAMATARFVHNTVDRMLSADPARQAKFMHFFVAYFSLTFAGVVLVRGVDRLTKRRVRS